MRLLPSNVSRFSGEIIFDGIDLVGLDLAEMERWRGKRLAMIFQDPMTALNPLFTVGTHLVDVLRRRFPDMSRTNALGRAAAMLGKVGIADAEQRLKAYPHELSGGMRQRVVIAMALLVEPDLLLADEPTTALDATVEAQIVELFSRLKHEFSGSVVFISHHLGLVAEFCDDLCVMYGGRIVETGPVREVLAAPRHPYTSALLACEIEDEMVDRLATIPGEVPDPIDDQDRCIFASRCQFAVELCLRGQPPLTPGPGLDRATACVRSTEVFP